MKKYFLFFIFFSPVFLSTCPHPIYVSTTQIEYNRDNKSIEIAIKIFSDDLEKAISESKGTTVEIGTDREHPKATEYICEYINSNFQLEVNGKVAETRYISRKLEKKEFFAMWVLIQVDKVRKLKTLKLLNNILIDLHPQQQNIISFRDADKSKKKHTTYKGHTNVLLK